MAFTRAFGAKRSLIMHMFIVVSNTVKCSFTTSTFAFAWSRQKKFVRLFFSMSNVRMTRISWFLEKFGCFKSWINDWCLLIKFWKYWVKVSTFPLQFWIWSDTSSAYINIIFLNLNLILYMKICWTSVTSDLKLKLDKMKLWPNFFRTWSGNTNLHFKTWSIWDSCHRVILNNGVS